MAEAVYAAIEFVAAALNTEMVLTAGQLYGASQAIAAVAAVYTLREQQRRSQTAQRNAYNASLRDRYVMVRSATAPRQVVLGRQRVSGPIGYVGSYGSNREHLVFTLILAAHECDAIEEIYFDDERVTLDGSGNVLAVNRRDLFTMTTAGAAFTLSSPPTAATVVAKVAYGTTVVTLGTSIVGSVVTVTGGTNGLTGTVTISYQPLQSPWVASTITEGTATVALNGSGTGSVVLSAAPDAGSVHAVYVTGSGLENQGDVPLDAYVSVVGATVTITAAPVVGVNATVTYRLSSSSSKMRVRKYLGAAGQTADAGMISALPGVWTSAHVMTSLAYLVIECDYDPDAFPGGLPNISALVRGAKLYDPRSSTTVWSENPALMMRYVAVSALLGRLSTAAVNDAGIITAANVCDASVNYVVNGQTHVRAIYKAGITLKSGTRAKDALDDLALAMAGRWCFIDGQMRVKAGAYVTPLQTLDESWLSGGPGSAATQVVQVQTNAQRADAFNLVTGKLADEQRDWQEVDYPRVSSSAYITADGAELPLDVQLSAVTFTGQAQQVVAAMMRDARQGIRVTLLCNMRAYPVEVFDTLYVTLSRFGWSSKPFEVMDVAWSLDGGIQLSLKETATTTWDMGASFSSIDPAPNTLFPSPAVVPAIAGLACVSGTGQLVKLADGSIVPRIKASWTAVTDGLVLAGGGVELRYGLSIDAESKWQSVTADQSQSEAYLGGVRDGLLYLVKARAFNALARGAWSLPVLVQAAGKSVDASAVAGFAGTVTKGRITWTWNQDIASDAGWTEVRTSDANWGSTSVQPLFKGRSNRFEEEVAAAATVTRYVRHFDTSGNDSAATASAAVVVANADLGARPVTIYKRAATVPTLPTGNGTPSGWSLTAPSPDGNPLWMSRADQKEDGTTLGAWAAVSLVDGESTRTVIVYKRADAVPSTPTGGGTPSGWAIVPPAADGNALWSSSSQQYSDAAGVAQLVGSWSTPTAGDAGAASSPVAFYAKKSHTVSGGPTNVDIKLKTDGNVQTRKGTDAFATVGKWFTPTGGTPGNSYQVRATFQDTNASGAVSTDITTGTLNTYQALSSDRTWILSSGSPGGDLECILTFEISASGGGVVLATGTAYLLAFSTP